MARRIKSRKSKHMGNRSFGGGNAKNRRGKGNRGGVGRAGYHKHRWLHTIKFEGTNKVERGESGFSNPTRRTFISVSLANLESRITRGEAKADAGGIHSFSLKGCKILSGGAAKHKMAVKASAFSEKAKQKIIAAGGTAEVLL